MKPINQIPAMTTVKPLIHLTVTMVVTTLVIFIYAAMQKACSTGGDDVQIELARAIHKESGIPKAGNNWLVNDPAGLPQSFNILIGFFKQRHGLLLGCSGLNRRITSSTNTVFVLARSHWDYFFTWKAQLGLQVVDVFESQYIFFHQMAARRSSCEKEKRQPKSLKTSTL